MIVSQEVQHKQETTGKTVVPNSPNNWVITRKLHPTGNWKKEHKYHYSRFARSKQQSQANSRLHFHPVLHTTRVHHHKLNRILHGTEFSLKHLQWQTNVTRQLMTGLEWSSGLNRLDLEVEVDEWKHKTLQILQTKTWVGNRLGIYLILFTVPCPVHNKITRLSLCKFKTVSQDSWVANTHPEYCTIFDHIYTTCPWQWSKI
jgi:hypothetical protein